MAFPAGSKDFAHDLTEAQTNPRWPGVLIVVSGKVGAPSKPFIAVIKAETDKGFRVVEEDGKISLHLQAPILDRATQANKKPMWQDHGTHGLLHQ